MLYSLVKALSRQSGFTHSVISLAEGNDFDFSALGVPVRCLQVKRGLPRPTALWRLRRWIRDARPDVVQGWMYHSNMAAGLAVENTTPVVWGIHHGLHDFAREKRLTRLIIRSGAWLAKPTKRIVYCSEASQYEHEAVGYPADKSLFIPNGFDCESFRPDPHAAARLRRELALSDDTLVIGHVARFHPVKNHVGLVRAFSRVAECYPKAHLVMVGQSVTPSNELLAEVVSTCGVSGRVHLLGERADISRLLPALDVYVSSSRAEAFPIVLGEAMACGIPCVSTDVGDSGAILGKTGRIVPVGDEVALAQGIRDLLCLTPNARRALGALARARVIAEYSLPAVAERYGALYRELTTAGTRV